MDMLENMVEGLQRVKSVAAICPFLASPQVAEEVETSAMWFLAAQARGPLTHGRGPFF